MARNNEKFCHPRIAIIIFSQTLTEMSKILKVKNIFISLAIG
jgi:hypothetical protein